MKVREPEGCAVMGVGERSGKGIRKDSTEKRSVY